MSETLQQQLDAANQRIAELEKDNEILRGMVKAHYDTLLVYAERAEAAGRKLATSEAIRAELLSAVQYANDTCSSSLLKRAYIEANLEEAERKLTDATCKLRDIRSNANSNHPDLKWLVEFIRDYADQALAQIDQPSAPQSDPRVTVEKLRAITKEITLSNPEIKKRIEKYFAQDEQPPETQESQ